MKIYSLRFLEDSHHILQYMKNIFLIFVRTSPPINTLFVIPSVQTIYMYGDNCSLGISYLNDQCFIH